MNDLDDDEPPIERLVRFYARDKAHEKKLLEASRIHGLDIEVAALRTWFVERVNEHPEDLTLMLKAVNALVRAVATQYRLGLEQRRASDAAFSRTLEALIEHVVLNTEQSDDV